jgi:hypothetical protein
MTIAPMALLGAAQGVFSLLGSLTRVARPTAALQEASFRSSVWHTVAAGLNVRQAAAADLAQAARSLYEAGMITLEECAVLSLDPVVSSGPLRTPADALGRVDWIAEFGARLDAAQARGDTREAARLQDALGILQRLAAARRGPLSCRA